MADTLMKNVVALLVLFLSLAEGFSQTPNLGVWPATLLENAWGFEQGSGMLVSGVEFEEDSGDFPTTKIPFVFHYGLSDDLSLNGTAQLVRFNLGDYTAWGGAESILGLRYVMVRGHGTTPNIQLKGELVAPSGGMSAVDFGAVAGLNMSWLSGAWGFHVNGKYTSSSENEKILGVSEIDRWRVAAGVDYRVQRWDWTWVFAFVGAQPVRPKPNEWSVEISNRFSLPGGLSLNAAGAGGLRQKGLDWLYRFLLDYRF